MHSTVSSARAAHSNQKSNYLTEADVIEQFCRAMREQDIHVTLADIVADGKLHRIRADGDRDKTVWFVLHADERPAGMFGDNRRYGHDTKFTWKADIQRKPLTAAEKRAYRERMERNEAQRAAEDVAASAAAAERANRLWSEAVDCEEHSYLERKGIRAHGVRVGCWEVTEQDTGEVRTVTKHALLIPMRDMQKRIHSLQAIMPQKCEGASDKWYLTDGDKEGHFWVIGRPLTHDGKQVIIICEGYATGASIHEATGHAVIIAFDAPNLLPVAKVWRERFPDSIIIIAADNDQWTLKPVVNPGVTRAHACEAAVGALVAIPPFDAAQGATNERGGRAHGPTDFNDLQQLEGAEAICGVFDAVLNQASKTVDAPADEGTIALRIVLVPTLAEALGAEYANERLADLEHQRVQWEIDYGARAVAEAGRTSAKLRDTVFVPYADFGLEPAVRAITHIHAGVELQILAAPGDEAEVHRVGRSYGALVSEPDSGKGWHGWGEYFLDVLFSRIDVKADADDALHLARQAIDDALRLARQAATTESESAASVTPARDEQRRRQQQHENVLIQEDDGAMIPSRLELDEMVECCVWLAEGEVVAYVTPDRSQFLTYKEFRSLTAESVTVVDVGKEGEAVNKQVLTAKLWQSDTRRKSAMTRTFKAGAGVICADPEGGRAVNLWRPIIRWPATTAIDLFLDHVAYLFENEVERHTFLDWCAHLEQKPGELPHYGWLHIASHTGCGRNWLASVLARVWRGYVAPNVDLPALLDSQYNGSISRRVLAIVDEIQEGGNGNRRHTNRLTALLNAETRLINPKFGRQFQEFNSCRWLVFSNFLNALPIDNTDRRWRVVTHERAPRPAADYERLYAALADKEFINAVGVFLRERDISRFKPGERPPLNAAKAAAIAASKSTQTTLAEDIRDHWPADIILNDHVAEILADQSDAGYTPAMRRAMEEVGAVAFASQIKFEGRAQRGWILRNTESWQGASKNAQRQEIYRAGIGGMRSASVVFADAMD